MLCECVWCVPNHLGLPSIRTLHSPVGESFKIDYLKMESLYGNLPGVGISHPHLNHVMSSNNGFTNHHYQNGLAQVNGVLQNGNLSAMNNGNAHNGNLLNNSANSNHSGSNHLDLRLEALNNNNLNGGHQWPINNGGEVLQSDKDAIYR